MAERKSFRFNSFLISLVAFKTIGSVGIPHPLAILSFFVKFAATAATPAIVCSPIELARAVRATSRSFRLVPTSAFEKFNNSLPPGTPISRSVSISAFRFIFKLVDRPLSRRNRACPEVQKKHSLKAEILPATTSDCALERPS